MKRQVLTDRSGRWFDRDQARPFDAAYDWDGRNQICRATGSQWEHQTLYRTAGGRWILRSHSNWHGTFDTWSDVDNSFAARWLVTNDYEPHPACAAEYAALEIA